LVYANAVFLENYLFDKFFDHTQMIIKIKFTISIEYFIEKLIFKKILFFFRFF